MSLVLELQKLRMAYIEKQDRIRADELAKTKEAAIVWADEVLTPLLIKSAHLGKFEITSDDFDNIDNPIYQQEIENLGLVITDKRYIPERDGSRVYALCISWL